MLHERIRKKMKTNAKRKAEKYAGEKRGSPLWGTDWQRGLLIFLFLHRFQTIIKNNCQVQVRLEMGCAPLNSGCKEWYHNV